MIRFAALLGKDINAKVHVLHFQYPQVYSAQDYMGATASEVVPDPVQLQKIAGEVKEKVENNTYDMVMLQSQAKQSFWLQDSLIMDVVRNVPCPVWIISPDAESTFE